MVRLNDRFNLSHSKKVKKVKVGGVIYDSGFEAARAQELIFERAAGRIIDFTPHPRVELIVNGYKIGHYTPDFLVEYPDGTKQYEETKGFPRPVFKLRWKIFFALYADQKGFRPPVCIMQGQHIVRNPKKL